jgi:hypothetical protein
MCVDRFEKLFKDINNLVLEETCQADCEGCAAILDKSWNQVSWGDAASFRLAASRSGTADRVLTAMTASSSAKGKSLRTHIADGTVTASDFSHLCGKICDYSEATIAERCT